MMAPRPVVVPQPVAAPRLVLLLPTQCRPVLPTHAAQVCCTRSAVVTPRMGML